MLAAPSDLEDTRDLPEHVEALVYTHEGLHCRGVGHNLGPVIIPGLARLNPKTGSVMNPNLLSGGLGGRRHQPRTGGRLIMLVLLSALAFAQEPEIIGVPPGTRLSLPGKPELSLTPRSGSPGDG